jgi:hypothetical protein
MVAAATGATVLFGVLGVSIIFGLVGYALYKLAEGLESTPLEAWTRRCFFGRHDENPPVHWNQPEDANRAISALNAVTLGVEAGVDFRARTLGLDPYSASGTLGIPNSIRQERYIEYSLRLPYFDPSKSAYSWTLALYGGRNNDTLRKVLAHSTSGSISRLEDTGSGRLALAEPSHTQPSSYAENLKQVNNSKKQLLQLKTFDGSITLSEKLQISPRDIAILSLTYWPDRDIAEGYVEIVISRSP